MGVTCCKRSDEEIEIKIPCEKYYIDVKNSPKLASSCSKKTIDSVSLKICISNRRDCNCKNDIESSIKKTIESNQELGNISKCFKKGLYNENSALIAKKIIKLQSYFRGIFYRRRFNRFINIITLKHSHSVSSLNATKILSNIENKPRSEIHLKNGRVERNNSISSNGNKASYSQQDNVKRRVSKADMDISKYFSGDMINGKKDGFGILTWSDGSRYIGFFKLNQAEGLGKQTHKNGDFYFGVWAKDRAEGLGYYYNIIGSKYEGEWKHDKQNGFGVEKWSGLTSTKYIGEFINGQKHGYGVLNLEDGSIYEGELKENFISGIGVLKYHDKKVYYGSWDCNKMNGVGILTWDDGKHFEGMFHQDTKEGFGVYWCGSKIYLGMWTKNKLEGEVCIIENNTIKNSLWREGKKVKYLESKSCYFDIAKDLTGHANNMTVK